MSNQTNPANPIHVGAVFSADNGCRYELVATIRNGERWLVKIHREDGSTKNYTLPVESVAKQVNNGIWN